MTSQRELPQGIHAGGVRARRVRALAGGGRLRPRRGRLDRGLEPAAVRPHPAAAQRDGLAPPRPRAAHHGRGPDGPPRADGRPAVAVPARPRPREHRRAVRAGRDPRQGGREPRHAGSRALPRADARVRRRDPRGDPHPAAAARRELRLGTPPLHDGRGQRAGRAGRVRAPVPRRPGVPHRGARQLVPGLRDQRQRPRGDPHARDRDAVDRPLPPRGPGDRRTRIRTPPSPSPPRARRRSSATPPSPCIPTTPGTRRSSGGWCGSRSWTATCRSSRTRSSIPRSGRARSRSRPAHDHNDNETGKRHGLAMPTILDDAARVTDTGTAYDGLDRYEARTAIVADLDGAWRPRRRAAARDGHRALPAQRRRRGAAAQDPVVRPDGAARRAGARGHPERRDADPARAVRQGVGALDDEHPGLERLAPAVVGPPDPGLVLPGRPRHGHRRRPTARAPARSAPAPRRSSSRSGTSSTPGSAPACGRSRPSAGRTPPRTSAASIPAR